MADYYDLLGVGRDADADTLKRAYRSKARKFHPDINKEPGAEDRFKEIGRAYEVLSDPQTRARYDQFGEAGLGGAAVAGRPLRVHGRSRVRRSACRCVDFQKIRDDPSPGNQSVAR